LSFGCSTGEECASLREKYFLDDPIAGVDIDEDNLQSCLEKNIPDTEFLYSNHRNLSKHAPYQAIFAMSVLCHWPKSKAIQNISGLYTFDRFESKLSELHSLLQIGGLLIVFNANFRFCDTVLYNKYNVMDTSGSGKGNVHKFGKDNMKLKEQTYAECIFIKKFN